MVNNMPSTSIEMSATPSKCALPLQNKLAILNMIKNQKDILFGKFTVEVENVRKIEAWENILNKAKSLNMVTNNRTWTYIRDQLYGGWKTRAIETRQFETDGFKWWSWIKDNRSRFIFEIIGVDSPTINGIEGSESGRSCLIPASHCNESDENLMSFEDFAANTNFVGIFSPHHSQNPPLGATSIIQQGDPLKADTQKQGNQTSTKKRHVKVAEPVEKKRKLQISVLRLEEYKLQLETFKLERELNIEHSDMTKDLLEKVLK